MNPYKFRYQVQKNSVQFFTRNASRSVDLSQEEGKKYIKMKVSMSHYNHDGTYCSDIEYEEMNEEDLYENKEIVDVYINIPEDMADNEGNLLAQYYDEEDNIIENERTESMFFDWEDQPQSCCNCLNNITEKYTVLTLKYIK